IVREQVSDAEIEELPQALAKVHWLFLRAEDALAPALAEIGKAARTDFALAALHTRLSISTEAWTRNIGDLLRGKYLKDAAEAMRLMESRAPLLPAATPQM